MKMYCICIYSVSRCRLYIISPALHRNEGDLDFHTYIYERYFYYYYPRCNSNADIALIADAQGEAR